MADLAELQAKEDELLKITSQLSIQMDMLNKLLCNPIEGNKAIEIIAKLSPGSERKLAEVVVGRATHENAYEAKYRGLDYGIVGEFDALAEAVFTGYSELVTEEFTSLLAKTAPTSVHVGDLLACAARVHAISENWDAVLLTTPKHFTDIIPFGHNTGDYATMLDPLGYFKEHLRRAAMSSYNFRHDIYGLPKTLTNLPRRLHLFKLLFNYLKELS